MTQTLNVLGCRVTEGTNKMSWMPVHIGWLWSRFLQEAGQFAIDDDGGRGGFVAEAC